MSQMSDYLVKANKPDFADSNALMKSGIATLLTAADPFKNAMNKHYDGLAKRTTDSLVNYARNNDMNTEEAQQGLANLMSNMDAMHSGADLAKVGDATVNSRNNFALDSYKNDVTADTRKMENILVYAAKNNLTPEQTNELVNNSGFKTSPMNALLSIQDPQYKHTAQTIETLARINGFAHPNTPNMTALERAIALSGKVDDITADTARTVNNLSGVTVPTGTGSSSSGTSTYSLPSGVAKYLSP